MVWAASAGLHGQCDDGRRRNVSKAALWSLLDASERSCTEPARLLCDAKSSSPVSGRSGNLKYYKPEIVSTLPGVEIHVRSPPIDKKENGFRSQTPPGGAGFVLAEIRQAQSGPLLAFYGVSCLNTGSCRGVAFLTLHFFIISSRRRTHHNHDGTRRSARTQTAQDIAK